jgi:hypothetical protein
MTRGQALAVAAAIIAKSVPDLPGLIALLKVAGQLRLAAALRAGAGGKPAGVGGAARPDAAFWAAEALKVLG